MTTTTEALQNFLDEVGKGGVFSTAAAPVNYYGVLYNVIGSTHDPHIGGYSWKGLLQHYGINGNCYVVDPPQNTHPQFNVGGHMTQNQDGSVTGGTCYLMPLCYWHNSSGNNHVAFNLTYSGILQLNGYMTADTALTFMARLPSVHPYSLIYEEDGEWHMQALSEDQNNQGAEVQLAHREAVGMAERHILLRKELLDGRTTFFVERSSL